ncbi:MAG TPA: polyketide synthase dehydratase domain-containing protein, partial [Pirellulaceae bacterium]
MPTQKLTVSHAFHSPLMDPMLDEFERFAATIRYAAPRIPIVANRTGELVDGPAFDAAYWKDHLRNAVEFAKGMQKLAEYGVDMYLEIGPAPVLVGMGRKCIDAKEAVWTASLRKGRDDWESLLGAAQDLYVAGQQFDWPAFDAAWPRRRMPLPTYPFKRNHFWMEGIRSRFGGAKGTTVHPLLGSPLLSSLATRLYETRMSCDAPKYLRDHAVQGSVVVPGAAYVEQGLALARLHLGDGRHGVEDLTIQRGLFLPAEGYRLVQTAVAPEAGGRTTFDTHSTSPEGEQAAPSWLHHVSGTLVHADTLDHEIPTVTVDPEDFARRTIRSESKDEFYELMRSRNLAYGPNFRVIEGIARTDFEARGNITIPDGVKSELGGYVLHPVIGDAIVQMTAGVIPLEEDGDYTAYTYVPIRFRSVRVYGP